MSDAWFFLIGMPIGGLAVFLFFKGRMTALEAELESLKGGGSPNKD